MNTYEEWRVTGDPGDGLPPYEFIHSPYGVARTEDPETAARNFVGLMRDHGKPWSDGPHLHKRTVTVTDWEAIEP